MSERQRVVTEKGKIVQFLKMWSLVFLFIRIKLGKVLPFPLSTFF
jgi:hypothetical protein